MKNSKLLVACLLFTCFSYNLFAQSSNTYVGALSNYNLIFETNNLQRMTILGNGNIGIGTSHPNYPLQIVGNVVDSGSIFANNIVAANGFSIGTFRIVNGVVDSIISTAGALQLNAATVIANGTISAGQSVSVGSGSSVISINGTAGTITSPSQKVSFANDTIATTAAIKAGSFQASYFKADSIEVSDIIPHDSIIYIGDPTPFINFGQTMSGTRTPCTCPIKFYSSYNGGFSFDHSQTSNGSVFLTVGGNKSDAELNVTGPYNGNLLFSATNTTLGSDVFTVDQSGNTYAAGVVGINTTNVPSGYSLAVNGAVIATDVYVELYANWPDYVFDKNYKHRSLEELEAYLNINHHLPDMPSAKEVKDKGSISVGTIVTENTKEIEELTLDLIELNKEVKALEEQNKKLIEEINKSK